MRGYIIQQALDIVSQVVAEYENQSPRSTDRIDHLVAWQAKVAACLKKWHAAKTKPSSPDALLRELRALLTVTDPQNQAEWLAVFLYQALFVDNAVDPTEETAICIAPGFGCMTIMAELPEAELLKAFVQYPSKTLLSLRATSNRYRYLATEALFMQHDDTARHHQKNLMSAWLIAPPNWLIVLRDNAVECRRWHLLLKNALRYSQGDLQYQCICLRTMTFFAEEVVCDELAVIERRTQEKLLDFYLLYGDLTYRNIAALPAWLAIVEQTGAAKNVMAQLLDLIRHEDSAPGGILPWLMQHRLSIHILPEMIDGVLAVFLDPTLDNTDNLLEQLLLSLIGQLGHIPQQSVRQLIQQLANRKREAATLTLIAKLMSVVSLPDALRQAFDRSFQEITRLQPAQEEGLQGFAFQPLVISEAMLDALPVAVKVVGLARLVYQLQQHLVTRRGEANFKLRKVASALSVIPPALTHLLTFSDADIRLEEDTIRIACHTAQESARAALIEKIIHPMDDLLTEVDPFGIEKLIFLAAGLTQPSPQVVAALQQVPISAVVALIYHTRDDHCQRDRPKQRICRLITAAARKNQGLAKKMIEVLIAYTCYQRRHYEECPQLVRALSDIAITHQLGDYLMDVLTAEQASDSDAVKERRLHAIVAFASTPVIQNDFAIAGQLMRFLLAKLDSHNANEMIEAVLALARIAQYHSGSVQDISEALMGKWLAWRQPPVPQTQNGFPVFLAGTESLARLAITPGAPGALIHWMIDRLGGVATVPGDAEATRRCYEMLGKNTAPSRPSNTLLTVLIERVAEPDVVVQDDDHSNFIFIWNYISQAAIALDTLPTMAPSCLTSLFALLDSGQRMNYTLDLRNEDFPLTLTVREKAYEIVLRLLPYFTETMVDIGIAAIADRDDIESALLYHALCTYKALTISRASREDLIRLEV